jgi:hypothetical protein
MRFRYKHPHTEDFIQIVNEVTGRDFTWFFDELFFNSLNFDYGISSLRSYEKEKHFKGVFDLDGKKEKFTKERVKKLKSSEKKSGRKKTYMTEAVIRRFGEAKIGGDVSLKLKVTFEDGSEEIIHWNGQKRWEKITFEKSAKAKLAQVDPDGIWLIDSNLTNNSLKRKSSKKGIRCFANKLLFWIQNCLHLISTLS